MSDTIKIIETIENQEYKVTKNGLPILYIKRNPTIWEAFTPDGQKTNLKDQYRHDLFERAIQEYT